MSPNRITRKTIGIFLCFMMAAVAAQAQILVVAPHPDDDILSSAGVICQAVRSGERVTVVYMTNGDSNRETRYGLARQAEAVAGQAVLGVQEDDLIFLGYPDGYLYSILTGFVYPGETVITTFNRSMTYGRRGLGRMDYHAYRFGTPANYNRDSILTDLQDILSMLLPRHIYLTSELDTHPDHSATFRLLNMAVMAVHAERPDYVPVLHSTIIHWGHMPWPRTSNPASLFPEIPGLPLVGLDWNRRESLNVPLSMQLDDYEVNPKYRAIAAHASQGGLKGYLKTYVHKDEFFWAENILGANQPPVANAGVDQAVSPGQAVVLDGSQSRDPEATALRFHWVQVSGGTVQLLKADCAAPSFKAPAKAASDAVLVFKLVVHDDLFASAPDFTAVTIKACR